MIDGTFHDGYSSLDIVVRALGGTLPLTLKVGGTEIFSKSDLAQSTCTKGGFTWTVDTKSSGAAITSMLNTGWPGKTETSSPADPYGYSPSDAKCATYIAMTTVTEEPNTSPSLVEWWTPSENNITIVVDPTGTTTGTDPDGETS